jgi:hypothetical protein
MDHPGMRFLHCRATTAEGEAVLVRPGSLAGNLTRRLATFPEEGDLQSLAAAMLNAEYIEAGVAGDMVVEDFLGLNPHLRGLFPDRQPNPVKVLIPRDTRRPGHADAPVYHLAGAEVSVWRSRFDSRDRSLRADLLLEPQRAGDASGGTSSPAQEEGGT